MVDAKIVFLDEVGAGVNKTLLRDISDSILKLPWLYLLLIHPLF